MSDRHGVPDLLLIGWVMVGECALAFIGALRVGADWQQTLLIIGMGCATVEKYYKVSRAEFANR